MATITSTSLTTNPTAIFTSDGTNVVTTMYFCNVDTSAHMFSLWLVANGDNTTNINMIYNNVSVEASDTFVIDREKIVLSNGDAIFASTDENYMISATVSNFSQ
jgi:hypothetical protein